MKIRISQVSLPSQIEEAMRTAIRSLAVTLRFEALNSATHQALIVTGWSDNDLTKQAIAHYLVGLRACAIDAALNIRANLADTVEDRVEILQSVLEVIGETNDELTDQQSRFKRDERNPWIAEGIWHLCMAIASQRTEIHPMGNIILLDYAHIKAKDHGLDVAAIYQASETTGISLIESKAYKNDPNGAINAAVGFFKDVDKGKHSTRIRQAIQIMRTALTTEQNATISASFWKQNRTYICNPHYHAIHNMDWTNIRTSFRSLERAPLYIAIMPHSILDFDRFFDDIAEKMRSFANNLQCMTNTQDN